MLCPNGKDNYLNYPALKKVIYLAQQDQLENQEPNDGSIQVNHALISDLVRIVRRNQAILERREANAAADLTDDDDVAVEKLTASKFINKFKNRKASKSADVEKEVTHEIKQKDDADVYLIDLENSTIAPSLDLDVWEAAAKTVHCNSPHDPLPVFTKDLIEELTKIDKFFKSKEAEIYKQYDNLIKDLEANKSHIDHHLYTTAYNNQDPGFYESNEHRNFNSFIELNKIGFTKICKKFDKTCNYAVKEDFINNFLPNNSRAFFPETSEKLDYSIDHMVQSYLRDHIVWERNTVWKDLLSLEKKNYNLHLDDNAVRSSKMGDEGFLTTLMHMQMKKLHFPFGVTILHRDHVKAPQFLFTSQMIKLGLVIVVFIVLMTVPTMHDKQQARCLAVLATAALSWATEALPLWVTSMMVPLLVVACKVLKATDGNGPMDAAAASLYILAQMWSATIMILLGGFTLAAALSKYNIAKVVSSFMLAFRRH
ncbi:hypothetical protein HF325_004127 [Metschnikowia pulcherrima]|uniref:SPX domain-containing protein n=1 Tax=Metschnikowia pulcherrima TaxID=27326 RepID=A0A8H7GSF9_9ASCO|nr:hypothetical protein HF325_004127 [Metschnikowia pulcherrima]